MCNELVEENAQSGGSTAVSHTKSVARCRLIVIGFIYGFAFPKLFGSERMVGTAL